MPLKNYPSTSPVRRCGTCGVFGEWNSVRGGVFNPPWNSYFSHLNGKEEVCALSVTTLKAFEWKVPKMSHRINFCLFVFLFVCVFWSEHNVLLFIILDLHVCFISCSSGWIYICFVESDERMEQPLLWDILKIELIQHFLRRNGSTMWNVSFKPL